MKFFSMFTGVGGFDLALTKHNHTCVGYSEIDKYANMIMKYHFPEVKNYGDATTIIPEQIPDFDLLVGGFPCQTFSIAGKRAGFNDTRGTLFFEIARILKAKRPKLFLLENVRGLLSHNNGDTFRIVLKTIQELGYEFEWQVLNSKYFGVPQNRERVFIIGHLRGTSTKQVFPIEQVESGTLKQINQPKHSTNRLYNTTGIARALRSQAGGKGAKTGLYIIYDDYNNNIKLDNIFGTLTTNIGNKALRNGQKIIHPCLNGAIGRGGSSKEYIKSLLTVYKSLLDKSKIRRLTPMECERLQSFPDNWTKYGIDETNKKVLISDTQRYKMMGNAVTVNVVEAIIKRF